MLLFNKNRDRHKSLAPTRYKERVIFRRVFIFAISLILSISALSPISSVLNPQTVSAIQASDCAEGEFVPSGPGNLGPAYCAGLSTCTESGGTWNEQNRTCSITYRPSTLADGKGYDWQVQSYIYFMSIGRCLQDSALRDGGWSKANDGFKWSDLKKSIPYWGSYEWYVDIKDSVVSLVDGQSISFENSGKYLFFQDPGVPNDDGLTTNVSPYMRTKLPDGTYRYDEGGKKGSAACADSKFIKAALDLWGYTSGQEALCDFGFMREKYDNPDAECVTDDTGGKWIKTDHIIDTFRSAIQNKVYGGMSPTAYWNKYSYSKSIEYAYYRESFAQSCLRGSGDDIPISIKKEQFDQHSDKDTKGYAIYNISDDGTGLTDLSYYIGQFTKTTNVQLIPLDSKDFGKSGTEVNKTCASMASSINDSADDFSLYVQTVAGATNQANAGSQGDGDYTTSSCPVDGIGWIVCPVMSALSTMNDAMFSIVENILRMNPIQMYEEDGVTQTSSYKIWQPIRDIANVLLVVAFIIIIFSQITSIGIDNYGIKKLFPKIVLSAIAINLSYFVIMLGVDIVNVLGSTLHDLINGLLPLANTVSGYEPTWTGLISLVGIGGTIAIIGANIGGAALALMILPFLITGALALLAAFLTLAIRNALVLVLCIVAPVAFAAYLLPNTKSLFDKWRKLLTSMLFLYPMAALLFAGAKLAGTILINTQDGNDFQDGINLMLGLTITAAPLFMLPWLAKSSGGILAKIGGSLSNLANKGSQAIKKNAIDDAYENRKSQYRANQNRFAGFGKARVNPERERLEQELAGITGNTRADKKKRKELTDQLSRTPERLNDRRSWGSRFENMSRNTKAEAEFAKATQQENWRRDGTYGAPEGARRGVVKQAQRASRVMSAQETLELRKGATDARRKEIVSQSIATPGSVNRMYDDAKHDSETATATYTAQTEQQRKEHLLEGAKRGASEEQQRLYELTRQKAVADEKIKQLDTDLKIEHLGNAEVKKATSNAAVSATTLESAETRLKAQTEQDNLGVFVDLSNAQKAKENVANARNQVIAEASAGTEEGKAAAREAGISDTTIDSLEFLAQEKEDIEFATGVANKAGVGKRNADVVKGREAPRNIGGEAAAQDYKNQAQERKSKLLNEAIERQKILDSQPGKFVVGKDETGKIKVLPNTPKGSDHLDRLRSYIKDPKGSGLTEEQVFASIESLKVMGGGSDMNKLYTEILPKFNADTPLVKDSILADTPEESAELASDIRSSIQQSLSTKGSEMAFGGPRIAYAIDGTTNPRLEYLLYAAEDPTFGASAMASDKYHSSSKDFLLDTLEKYEPANERERDLQSTARRRMQTILTNVRSVPQYASDASEYIDRMEAISKMP